MDLLSKMHCPIPIAEYPAVTLAHGGGGRLTQMLIERMFVPAFANPALEQLHDGAVLEVGDARLAFSTDSFVISPLVFPGGDIGSLAVYGTVNDVAMCGARPLALSAGLILEEGLPMAQLWQIVQSMQHAAARVGVPIVTGDTKVVDRGKGDQDRHALAVADILLLVHRRDAVCLGLRDGPLVGQKPLVGRDLVPADPP